MTLKHVLSLLLALPMMAFGQTIESSNYPVGGGYLYSYRGEQIQIFEGNSGENQNWDYSNLTAATLTEYSSNNCEETSRCDSFSRTNFYNRNITNGYNSYYSKDATGLYLTGYFKDNPGSYIMNNFSNARKILQFPLQFGMNYIDSFASMVTYQNSISYSEYGSINVIADATGNLNTPVGNYLHVIRIKTDFLTTTLNNAQIKYTSYQWFQSGIGNAIMEITKSEALPVGTSDPSFTYKFITALPINQTKIEEPLLLNNSIRIYPNPAKNFFIVASKLNKPVKVIVRSVVGSSIVQLDCPVKDEAMVNTEEWSRGIYIVEVFGESGEKASQKLILD